MTHAHDWRETGERGIHVEFPTKTQGKRQLVAIYLRCGCGQAGFRRPGSMVVYTWTREAEG